jgi:hypothetical protein
VFFSDMFEANSIWPLVGAPSSRADAEQKLRVNYEKAICSSNFEPKSRAPCAHTAKKQSKVRVCAFQPGQSSFCVESKLFILLTSSRHRQNN